MAGIPSVVPVESDARGDGAQGRRFGLGSLYARVLLINAMVFLVALLLLLWTPVTVSSRVSVHQVELLVAMFVVMVLGTAALLKVSFVGLTSLVARMQTLELLRPRERLPETGGAETRAVIRGFNVMLDRLEVEQLASTRARVTALEDERQRISRELHDEVGQRLTGILLQLGRILDETTGVASDRVCRVQDETRAVMDEIGTLAWRMRPVVLDDLGLLSALQVLAEAFSAHETLRIDVVMPRRLPPMPTETELAIYRVAQEALTNAVRHSGARTITITLQVGADELVLRVTDDGDGPPGVGLQSPGLRGMQERALLIGARLDLLENAPAGMRVELSVPTKLLVG